MSIRYRLYLLVFIATIIPTMLVALRYYRDSALAVDISVAELPKISVEIADDLAGVIAATVQLEYGLVRSHYLLQPEREACSSFLAEVRNAYAQFTGIITVEPDGSLLCDSLESGRELDLTDRAYFRKAQDPETELILEPVFGRLTSRAVIQVVYPARTQTGALDFLMVASLDLQRFIETYERRLPEFNFLIVNDAGDVFVSSEVPDGFGVAGESIAGTETFRLVRDRNGPVALLNPEGMDRVWGVAGLDGPEWISGLHILVGTDRDSLVKDANLRLRENLIMILIAATSLLAMVSVLAEVGVRRQFARVADMAQDLGNGEFGRRISAPYPRGELGTLMRQLNDAAQSLEQQRASIAELNHRLAQSQKMEAVGQLTGGVAHDFNNLLTIILGSAELLVENPKLDRGEKRLAEMVMTAAERGAEMTSRLLAFARRQPLQPTQTDVNHVISNIEPLLQRLLGENYEIEMLPGKELSHAMVDVGQLEAAILNLCLNARDAMPLKGKLMIETRNAVLDETYAVQQLEVTPGEYVVISISDNGSGMDAETLARAFEPFFTTKEVGKGSGLGLSMVYGFAKQSGGHIRLYSEPGQGTTARLYLPRASGISEIQPAPNQNHPAATGNEKILMVEDDAMVRDHVFNQLTHLGYVVVAASDGQSALRLLRDHADISLLFTDVVMPGGMNGPELAAKALELRPGLRVLFTSGYSDNAIIHHGRLDAGVHLLAKPYRQVELARKIRQVLEAEQV